MIPVVEDPLITKVGVGRRFAARLIDGLILFVPILVLTIPIAGGFSIGSPNTGSQQLLASALGGLLSFGYFVVLEAVHGRTIGKAILGITVRSDEGHPTLDQAAQRNAFMLLAIVPGPLGALLALGVNAAIALSISSDPGGRGFHDRFVGVTVTRV